MLLIALCVNDLLFFFTVNHNHLMKVPVTIFFRDIGQRDLSDVAFFSEGRNYCYSVLEAKIDHFNNNSDR